ncbi:LAETG motif-containing sortase-dependent surface protein [Streptomyces sp. FIT100]|uniref:LAETG motif-containing sortase-dependent surface protein n=1 Tax=Streptomyces sp. FIT100 TaxID=2837956 RepID=UPI0021C79CA0|nr:LAETG motif-containing sortase-dependent surface protein [Streptomyces sp. FIT100]UUN28837.1 hypothetical protein KK483_22465 [Streptomyces sp. FIT100]
MSVARRPLLTAAAAGTLLCALWFVPSANATAEAETAEAAPSAQQPAAASASDSDSDSGSASGSGSGSGSESASAAASRQGGSEELRLAETGSVDTTPYVIGGAVFLAIGAGFLSFSVRQGARDIA